MPLTIVGKAEGTGSGAWNELDADVYDCTLTAIEDGGVSQFDGKEQFKITFTLDLQDEAGDPIVLFKWVNKVLSPKSNLAGIIEACGKTWEAGSAFDLEGLAPSRCRVMVNISDKSGRRYVADVLPPKTAGKAAPKAAAKTAATSTAPPVPLSDTPCCVPGCKREITAADGNGNFFCEKHAPDEDE